MGDSEQKGKFAGLRVPDSVSRLAEASTHLSRIDEATKHLRAVDTLVADLTRHQALMRGLDDPLGQFTRVSALSNFIPDLVLRDVERQKQALEWALGPTLTAEKVLPELNPTAWREAAMLDTIYRPSLGPLSDLRESGILANLASSSPKWDVASLIGDYEGRFRHADVAQLWNTKAWLENKATFAAFYATEAALAASQVRSPWLDMENSVRSAAAFAELHSVGYALKILEPFSTELLSGLRSDFGDWRDRITFPEAVLGNLRLRSEFYAERGFRGDLTDFPAAAFEESLETAELIEDPPTLVELYGEPFEIGEHEDVSAFLRTNRAHLWLMCFETQLREFIDQHMTRAFGENWPKGQLVGEKYDEWLNKKRRAEAAGKPSRPLICYADFTDYELIICRCDNWKLFAAYFKDPANRRESLQRLYLPRVETMHSRPLSQEDELLLFAELKRLARVIRRP